MAEVRNDIAARRAAGGESGVTLLGILIAGFLLTIGVGGLVSTLIYSGRLSRTNRGTVQAAQLARHVMESIRAVPSIDAFAMFNNDPNDDPNGVGTAPGHAFPLSSKAGQVYVEIEFPGGSTPGVLREDVSDAGLGMPRDLNADGTIDALDHSGDYVLLPVRVRVRWTDATGERTFELENTLVNR